MFQLNDNWKETGSDLESFLKEQKKIASERRVVRVKPKDVHWFHVSEASEQADQAEFISFNRRDITPHKNVAENYVQKCLQEGTTYETVKTRIPAECVKENINDTALMVIIDTKTVLMSAQAKAQLTQRMSNKDQQLVIKKPSLALNLFYSEMAAAYDNELLWVLRTVPIGDKTATKCFSLQAARNEDNLQDPSVIGRIAKQLKSPDAEFEWVISNFKEEIIISFPSFAEKCGLLPSEWVPGIKLVASATGNTATQAQMIIKYKNSVMYGETVSISRKDKGDAEAAKQFVDDIQFNLFTKFMALFEKIASFKDVAIDNSTVAYRRVTSLMSELNAQAFLGRKAAYDGRNRIMETLENKQNLTAYSILTAFVSLPALYAAKPRELGTKYGGTKEYSERNIEKAGSFSYKVITEGTWDNELPDDKNWNFL